MLWGFTNTWTLWLSVVIGIWLMMAPAFFGIGIRESAANSDHVVGALIVVVSIIALAEVARPVRFLNIPLGVWLLITPWFLSGATRSSQWNGALMGPATILLSLPLGKLRDHYGKYDSVVIWSPRRTARDRHAQQPWGPEPLQRKP